MTFILQLGILSILAALIAPHLLKAQKKAPLTVALSNARQIAMALFDFDNDYAEFPSASTINSVRKATRTDLKLGDSTSNDLFRQLLAANIVTTEEIFYLKQPGTRKPDNVISATEALAQGECGFSYILPGTGPVNMDRPLLAAPLVPGTLKFDPGPFNGKAVVLKMDNSCVMYPVNADGEVIGAVGLDIFDPRQTYWNGVPPVVKWPDLLPAPPTPFYRNPYFAIGVPLALVGASTAIFFRCRRRKRSAQPA